jgi:hypothetical protein
MTLPAHLLHSVLSSPLWLSAVFTIAICGRMLTVCQRVQAIWINALVIEQLRAAIGTPTSSNASPGEARTRECYGARARYEAAHRTGKSTHGSRSKQPTAVGAINHA